MSRQNPMPRWLGKGKDPVKIAFSGHVVRARRRGIEFHFTFEEWVKWWEDHLGPDWLKKRGLRKDQYQMARNGDTGPYAAWNVQCKTATANGQDRGINGVAPKGIKHGRAKLTEEQVLAIFRSDEENMILSRRYNIAYKNIMEIKTGKIWSSVTGRIEHVDV